MWDIDDWSTVLGMRAGARVQRSAWCLALVMSTINYHQLAVHAAAALVGATIATAAAMRLRGGAEGGATTRDERLPWLRRQRVRRMGIEELSPLLTLLDALLGHNAPIVPPLPTTSEEEDHGAAEWPLGEAFSLELRFLARAAPSLKRTLGALGYQMAVSSRDESILCLRYLSNIEARAAGRGGMVSRGEVRALIEMVSTWCYAHA